MKDCRSGRQPTSPDAKIRRRECAGGELRRQNKFWTQILETMAPFALPITEVLVVADCWQSEPDAEAVIQRAVAAAAEIVDAGLGEAELAVMLTDDAGIRTLNSNWRGIDKPTNVLSFPALQPTGAGGPDGAPRMLGDIAIAYQTTRREADDEQKPFDHHLSHLAVHGFLHLIGYDHEKDDDAETMETLEQEILAQLDIPDPYADRGRMD
jgi:probable rRNA maturation factor